MADGADGFGEGFGHFLWKGLGLLLTGDFLMFGLFLHGVLLQTLNNNTLGHKRRDLILEI